MFGIIFVLNLVSFFSLFNFMLFLMIVIPVIWLIVNEEIIDFLFLIGMAG